uniref:J domain-containing protein n=1 Tax=Spongospora subterranea TaxID=70186 RepID=A0A0H5R9I0_9EUKA|eukprot:CRZ10332.1 hypothetical protein [Spongospora subterranea]
MSIANRDSSAQCLANSREASKQHDLGRAVRLCEKSLRLYPTDEAKTFLSALRLKLEKQERSQDAAETKAQAKSRRRTPSPKKDVRQHGPVFGDYTEEQQRAALEIRNTTCYYTRLKVENKCSDIDIIKKAYKKMAFQFHPDKNHAPASAEAFKAINQAYECLTDENRKAAYDRYGTEDPSSINSQSRGGGGRSMYRTYTASEDVLTPEDILNMFFTGGAQEMPFQRRRARHHAPNGGHGQNQSPSAQWRQLLLQFLPVILLFLFSMWSGPSSSGAGRPGVNNGLDEVFSLSSGNGFSIQRTTADNRLVYFVRPQFQQWYGHDRRAVARVDHLVTMAHIASLRTECDKETIFRGEAIAQAKEVIGSEQSPALSRAHGIPLPSCEKLSQIYAQ